MEKKYRLIKNYQSLKRGQFVNDSWDRNLLGCFRSLPSSEVENLECFARRSLLSLPAPADDSRIVSETEVCQTLVDYLFKNNYLEKIYRVENKKCRA